MPKLAEMGTHLMGAADAMRCRRATLRLLAALTTPKVPAS